MPRARVDQDARSVRTGTGWAGRIAKASTTVSDWSLEDRSLRKSGAAGLSASLIGVDPVGEQHVRAPLQRMEERLV